VLPYQIIMKPSSTHLGPHGAVSMDDLVELAA
jgi:hypothetical protein